MLVLAMNAGSSSLKAALLDTSTGHRHIDARVERVGGDATLTVNDAPAVRCDGTDHQAALRCVLGAIGDVGSVEAVGHRVVHGGEAFDRPTAIDAEVEAAIEALVPRAPLHNPANLAGIRAARALLPGVPHVAVFDTAFHNTLPRRARTYALPLELSEQHGLRRFGFHGISHRYVAARAADALGADLRDLRVITCHLGNGCSAAAIEYGRSVETSMGMTPLEGLVMGTRSGDVDPGIVVELMRREGLDADGLDELLNRQSGLAGLSGIGHDVRDITSAAAEGDDRARLALQVFAHRVRQYIGAYAAVMGGVDAIVFTAGIGENSVALRHRIAQRLEFLGAHLDEEANRAVALSDDAPCAFLSTRGSRCHLLAVRTDEQLAIARDTAAVVRELGAVARPGTIPIAISARHVHLTRETLERLFGRGYELSERNPLSQPGQFAAEETVDVVGPRSTLAGVRILGPLRSVDQVEISRTDEFALGIDAPVRASGDVANTPGIVLRGPAGEVELTQGVICAWRHIHMTPEDAIAFGVRDRDVVEVRVEGGARSLVFGDVLVRVKDTYRLEMHIDTDEGNAAELGRGATGALIATDATAALQRRRTTWDPVIA